MFEVSKDSISSEYKKLGVQICIRIQNWIKHVYCTHQGKQIEKIK